MTDYLTCETARTLAEARESTRSGYAWAAVAAALALLAGACAAHDWTATGLVLAVWACAPGHSALDAWAAAGNARELAEWMAGTP